MSAQILVTIINYYKIISSRRTHFVGADADDGGVETAVIFGLKTTELICWKPSITTNTATTSR